MGKCHPLSSVLILIITLIITIPPSFNSAGSGSVRTTPEEPFELVEYLGLGEAVDIKYSPDGSKLAVIASTRILILSSTTFEIKSTLIGHINGVTDISWSPDGKKLASSSLDTTARIWDIATSKTELIFNMHVESVNHIEWSPDVSSIVTSSEEAMYEVLIWDPVTGDLIDELSSFDYYAKSIAWSPDGSMLAVGEGDGDVRVYNTVTWKRLTVLECFDFSVHDLEWSHDSKLLATGSNKKSIKIWDTTDWSVNTTLLLEYSVWDFKFSSDDSKLAVCTSKAGMVGTTIGIVSFWNTNNWTEAGIIEPGFEYEPHMCSWHPDGTEIATVGVDGYAVFDSVTGETLHYIGTILEYISKPDWSSDGTKLIIGNRARVSRTTYDYHSEFIVYDTTKWEPVKQFTNLSVFFYISAWSSDSSMLAFGYGKNALAVYSTTDWELITRLDTKFENITDVKWSPDDSRVAVASYEDVNVGTDNYHRIEEVEVWDTSSWLRMRPLANLTNRKYPAWNSDGSRLALGSQEDKTLEIFDSENIELLSTHENDDFGGMKALDWSIDDSTFAVFTPLKVRLIDTTTWFNFKNLSVPYSTHLPTILWSPDGTRLAAGPFEGTGTNYGGWNKEEIDVYVWDCGTWERLQNLSGHADEVKGFSWSPDSRSIATGASDGTVNIWEDSAHVPNTPPKVVIKSVDSDPNNISSLTISGTAEDNVAVVGVEVKIGEEGSWQAAEGTTSWSFEWRTGSIFNIELTVFARSYDGYIYSKPDSYELVISNPDYDGDGVPDIIDTDDDNDGYIDANELELQTNPQDYMSMPKDKDNDLIPDEMDVDIDNDGVVNSEDSDPYDKTKWDDSGGEILLWITLALITTIVAILLFVIRLKLGGRKKQ